MRAINLSNARTRNAQVGLDVKAIRSGLNMGSPDGRSVRNVRMLKFTPHTAVEILTTRYGADLTETIINSDMEIDTERVGLFLNSTKKVFLDSSLRVAHRVSRQKVLFTPDGKEKEARPFKASESNINVALPLRWTGKMIPKTKAVRMFAFIRKYQVKHINGLTFDFLQSIARELHENGCMMLIGAGAKGVGPLVMSTGGTPYRAFLEGRMSGDRYCLMLHLTNLELKTIS
ncbi:MAG: hypothetical protein K2K76_10890 [Muribaculaceae bacterium]|nr:hypothetical protein [Muribaculaceae bacterium]